MLLAKERGVVEQLPVWWIPPLVCSSFEIGVDIVVDLVEDLVNERHDVFWVDGATDVMLYLPFTKCAFSRYHSVFDFPFCSEASPTYQSVVAYGTPRHTFQWCLALCN